MLSGTNMGAKITFERLGASTGGDLSFHTRPVGGTLTQRFVLRSDGNVGVGTNAPATKLQVAGNLNLETSGGDVGLWLHRTDAREYRLYVDSNGLLNLRDQDAGATRMAFKTDGNLGIATTTPGAKLHVNGDAIFENNGSNINIKNTWSSGNHDINFIGGSSSGGSANNTAARIRCLATAPGGAATGSLTFTVNSGDTFVDALYIKEDGNIGIGTNAPNAALTVADSTPHQAIFKTAQTTSSERAGGGFSSLGHATATSRYARLFLDADGANFSGTDYFTIEKFGNSGEVKLLQYSNANMSFWVNTSTQAMTIKNDGNVGIGHGSPNAKLSIKGDTEFLDENTGVRIGLLYDNGTEGILDLRDNNVTKVNLRTAGDSYFTGGNVGIGTNAPGAKLHVRGSDGYLKFDTSGADGTIKSDYNLKLYADDNNNNSSGYQNIQFYTAGANERMRINSNGKVLINDTATTNNNNAQLYVNGPVYGSEFDLPSGGAIDWANGDARIVEGLSSNYSLSLQNYDGSSAMVTTMFLKSGGNVGIGTVDPDARLDIRSATGQVGLTVGNTTGDTRLQITSSENSDVTFNVGDASAMGTSRSFIFKTGSSERMRIEGGNVGIGTNNPSAKLESYITSAGTTKAFRLNTNFTGGNAVDFHPFISGVSNAGFSIDLAGTNRFTINSSGNVGIGTNNGVQKLHLQSATCIVRVVSTTANSNASIWFNSNVGGTNADRWEIGTNISAGSSLEIYDRLNGASRMVVKNDGNVGIGTNAPLDKLDVYGSGAVFRNLSDNADSVQIVRGTNHNANPDAKFYIYDNSSADWAAKINLDGASYGLDIQNGSDYFLLCRKVGGDRILEVHGSSTVVNDAGIDYDFRVESNNDDYLLYTDGGNDRVAISTNTPAAKLHVEGDFKVGTTNNGNWMGYKDVSLNGNTYTTALTINLNNHTGCYVKLFLSGDWSSHSAVAFVGEYFIQNGSDGYAEPGTVISEFDNTNTDSIESKIVDPSSDTFTIQLKLSTAANGTLGGKLSYHVMGMATAVS